jgi:hypothetical protein
MRACSNTYHIPTLKSQLQLTYKFVIEQGGAFLIIISSKAIKDIMDTRRILFTILVIIFFILAVSSQLGVDSRPLQNEQFNGLLLQLLPRGPSKPSAPDDGHHH